MGSRLGINGGTLRVNVQGADLLLGGDVILSVNNIAVTAPATTEPPIGVGADDNYERILNSLVSLKTGDTVILTVLRAGKIVKLTTTIEP
jgi:hypothetical protein